MIKSNYRKTWIKDIVKIIDEVIYIPKNYKEMIKRNEKYDVVYSNDSQRERLLNEYFGGIENTIPCQFAVSMGDAGCSFLEPVESVEEGLHYIKEIEDVIYFGKWTNKELRKRFPNVPVKLHPNEVEKQYGIVEKY